MCRSKALLDLSARNCCKSDAHPGLQKTPWLPGHFRLGVVDKIRGAKQGRLDRQTMTANGLLTAQRWSI